MDAVERQAGTVSFQAEALANCWDEALPLMRSNYEETGTWQGEFNPDLQKLKRMEEAGFVRVFTARIQGKLVGYQVFFVMFGINHPAALMAVCHVAYVSPVYRGLTAIKFLHWTDQQLLFEGTVSITRQSTVYHPLDKLYTRMKYHKIEECWMRVNPFAISIMHGGFDDGGGDDIDPMGGP